MDVKITSLLRYEIGLLAMQRSPSRRILSGLVVVLVASSLLVTGCQNRTSRDDGAPVTAPDAAAPPESTAPPSEAVPEPEATPEPNVPASSDSPEPVAQAPANAPTAQSGPILPDALKRQWEPASNVLFTFGSMTITPDQVQWGSGQSSAYTVVSTDGGYLLQLESIPSFYETKNPYIKLIPQTDASGGTTSMDVAFYESDAKARNNEYIMYGSYFVE